MTQNERQWECMKWNGEDITWDYLKKGNDEGWSGIKVGIIN